MDHARDLGLAPALLDVQGADEVRPFLAAVVMRGRAAVDADIAVRRIRAAAGAAVGALALRCDRRREAAAERGGIGQQVRLVEALLVGRGEVRPVVAAAGERIERLRLTGGDARPGQVASVEVGQLPVLSKPLPFSELMSKCPIRGP